MIERLWVEKGVNCQSRQVVDSRCDKRIPDLKRPIKKNHITAFMKAVAGERVNQGGVEQDSNRMIQGEITPYL